VERLNNSFYPYQLLIDSSQKRPPLLQKNSKFNKFNGKFNGATLFSPPQANYFGAANYFGNYFGATLFFPLPRKLLSKNIDYLTLSVSLRPKPQRRTEV